MFAVCSVVITLAIVELMLGIFGINPPISALTSDRFRLSENPVLRYELIPGRNGINSLGIRNEEVSQRKRKGVSRIVVQGDSVIFGAATCHSLIRL
jgi:hypothetical protein